MNLLFWIKNKYSTKEGQILAYLKRKGLEGASQQELNRIQFRYGASIHELRKEGHDIRSVQVGYGKWRFYYEGESNA
jgi:hypothetical protein